MKNGSFEELVREARVIQNHLNTLNIRTGEENRPQKFAKFMRTGQTNAALRMLSDESQGHSLPLDQLCSTGETVREVLKSKQPTSSPPTVDALIPDSSPEPEFHPILFENITGQKIRQIVLRCRGSAGPSGLDASAWQRLCTSFGRCSADLCSSIAALARRLCTDRVDPAGLSSFLACRLIALNKSPGRSR